MALFEQGFDENPFVCVVLSSDLAQLMQTIDQPSLRVGNIQAHAFEVLSERAGDGLPERRQIVPRQGREPYGTRNMLAEEL